MIKRSMKIILATAVALAIVVAVFVLLIQLNIVRPVEQYRINNLIVTSPGGTGLMGWRSSDWHTIEGDENVTFKIMSLEPVVRRSEFITHEVIAVSYYLGTGVAPNAPQYLSEEKAQLATVIGLMAQKFLEEGFDIGKNSSFMKIAGADAYRFELIKHEVESEYTWHILLVWKRDWYLITYSNFGNPFPGPHFPDFERFLDELELVH